MRKGLSRRAVLGGVALVLLGGCGGAAAVLASRWPAADLAPLERATEPVVVWDEVSEQPLRSPVSVVGLIHPPRTKDVFAPQAAMAGTGEAVQNASGALEPARATVDGSAGAWDVAAIGAGFGGSQAGVDDHDPDGRGGTGTPGGPDGEAEVGGPAELETLRLVVTIQKLTPDQLIGPGDLVAEVSGRPVFAVPPGMPLFRNLVVGAEGADVRALQGFLEPEPVKLIETFWLEAFCWWLFVVVLAG